MLMHIANENRITLFFHAYVISVYIWQYKYVDIAS